MAAPVTTPRVTPSGYKMPDGFKTLIAHSAAPAVQIWEKIVKPPGVDGGASIETTTMHNISFRTMAARQLKSMMESTFRGFYDPDFFPVIFNLVNVEGSMTVTFPDHSTLAFFGYIMKLEFGENEEGKPPEVTVTFVPTNWDPVGKVEAAPVFVPAPGT